MVLLKSPASFFQYNFICPHGTGSFRCYWRIFLWFCRFSMSRSFEIKFIFAATSIISFFFLHRKLTHWTHRFLVWSELSYLTILLTTKCLVLQLNITSNTTFPIIIVPRTEPYILICETINCFELDLQFLCSCTTFTATPINVYC